MHKLPCYERRLRRRCKMANRNRKFIPQEVASDILSRVKSAKSLVRFRCVSKTWQSLIQSPEFVNLHLARSSLFKSENPVILFKYQFPGRYLETVDDSDGFTFTLGEELIPFLDQSRLYVAGSCDGLVCLSVDVYDPCISFLTGRAANKFIEIPPVFLCNPGTREFKKLPVSPLQYIGAAVHAVCGFGFDPVANDYKVVQMVFTPRGPLKAVAIYTLSTGSWKIKREIVPGHSCDFGSCYICRYPFTPENLLSAGSSAHVTLNGFIHWTGDTKLEFHEPCSIVAFDLVHEELDEIELPPGVTSPKYVSLGVLQECLALVAWWSHDPVEVWVMKEYGFSWTKEFVIPTFEAPRVLGVGIGGQNFMYETPEGVVLCDFDINEKAIIQRRKNIGVKYSFILQFVPYIQSLLRVDTNSEM